MTETPNLPAIVEKPTPPPRDLRMKAAPPSATRRPTFKASSDDPLGHIRDDDLRGSILANRQRRADETRRAAAAALAAMALYEPGKKFNLEVEL